MEETRYLGIAASQIPLMALMVAIASVIIALEVFVINQLNAVNGRLDALIEEMKMNTRRSYTNARIERLRAERTPPSPIRRRRG